MTVKETLLASEYIIAALRNMIDGTPTPRIPEGVNYGTVYNLAKAHSLHGAVFASIESDLKSDADPRLYEHWKKERDISFIVNMKQKAEFLQIVDLFTREKLSFLPLKGFMLKELYPSPELRTMSDLDIFVSTEQIDRAKELMKSIGYENKSDGELHDSMEKPPYSLVELHKLVEAKSPPTFSNCKTKEDNPYWYLMKDEDVYVFLVNHAYKHYSIGGCGIRTVLDLYLYKRKNKHIVDSPLTVAKLSERELTDFCEDILALGDLWFSGKETDRDLTHMIKTIVMGGTYGTIANQIESEVGQKGKFKYVLSRLFPHPKLIKRRYKWVRKVPILLPIGYIWRWIQSLFNGRIVAHVDAFSEVGKRKKQTEKQNEK